MSNWWVPKTLELMEFHRIDVNWYKEDGKYQCVGCVTLQLADPFFESELGVTSIPSGLTDNVETAVQRAFEHYNKYVCEYYCCPKGHNQLRPVRDYKLMLYNCPYCQTCYPLKQIRGWQSFEKLENA